jgi:hypothetical protein
MVTREAETNVDERGLMRYTSSRHRAKTGGVQGDWTTARGAKRYRKSAVQESANDPNEVHLK